MWVDRPAEFVLEYTAQMMVWLVFLEPARQQTLGLLGLGAGSMVRFCLKHTSYPLTVVEHNPLVTSACEMYFKLPRPARLTLEHQDAGKWVESSRNWGLCSALMVDIYDGQAQGPVLDSLAFYEGCRAALADIGVMSVNLFGAHASFARNIRNISQAFGGRILTLPQIDAGNQVVLAFKGPHIEVGVEQLLVRAEYVESKYGLPAKKWVRSMMGRLREGVLAI
jgi:spermidine synthase